MEYRYPTVADPGNLINEIVAAGLPQPTYRFDGPDIVLSFNGVTLTPAQKTTLDGVVAAHAGPRKARRLYDIYQAITALTATQKTNIWTDLSSGSPPKWATDLGPNAAAIMALHWSVANSGATAANVTDAKMRLTAAYCQDVPLYLVHPTWDSSINVPGDEPGP